MWMSDAGWGRRRSTEWLLVIALTTVVTAHDFSQSESLLEVAGSTVRARIRINLLEIEDVDANVDQRVSYDELDRSIERVFAAIKEHFVLRAPDAPDQIVAERYEIGDDHVLQIDVAYTFSERVRRLELTSRFDVLFAPGHQHLAAVSTGGETMRAVLDRSNRTVTVDLARVTAGRVAAVMLAGLGLLFVAWYRLRPRRVS
jgi:hypothetical protein